MSACLELFLAFFKIGLFTFGGGYGMIPIVQQEVVGRGWMDAETLIRYIGICESTPGPIAVNMATFVGSNQAGVRGALCATLGVVLPSFVIILFVAGIMDRFRRNRTVQAAMGGIRPVVAGLITGAGVSILLKCLFGVVLLSGSLQLDIWQLVLLLALAGTAWTWKKALKRPISPIVLILISAGAGIIAYGAG